MKKIAIVPARGGSKRIPRKNIKSFLGKPIITYSIEAALKSSLFDEVMVSTDDEEIAEVSKKYGAKVPFLRSVENSNDFATTAAVIDEVLSQYSSRGQEYTYCCCIYPTAPLITIKRLQEAFELLVFQNFASVFPVVKFSYPIWRSFRIEGGKAFMNWPEYLNSRSQDLPNAYHDVGQFYWLEIQKFNFSKRLFSDHTGVVELNDIEVQDIDTISDWKLAEIKYQILNKQGAYE